jgi:hypothetical protein
MLHTEKWNLCLLKICFKCYIYHITNNSLVYIVVFTMSTRFQYYFITADFAAEK